MSLLQLITAWYFYSKFYILGSILVTHILNLSFKKYWISPLIVNAVCVIMLAVGIGIGMIKNDEIVSSIYFGYLPIVFTSIVMNISIILFKKLRRKNNGKF